MHYSLIVDKRTYYESRLGRDRMVVGFITTYAISVHHHYRYELESHSLRRGVLNTTLCDKACQ
jgi:hypothetical protein